MKALILNSGLGTRMGVLNTEHPKCMIVLNSHETNLSRQLKLFTDAFLNDVVFSSGYFYRVLINYCNSLDFYLHYIFVKNHLDDKIKYIQFTVQEFILKMTLFLCKEICYLKKKYLLG